MHLGIVCGYGLILDQNLIKYLENVIKICENNKIYNLVLSGGYTSGKLDISEARLMFDFIQKHNREFNLILEEESLTTLHNLLESKKIIDNLGISYDMLYIFCDDVRFLKVCLLSKIIFNGQCIKVINLARKEPIIWYLIQIPSTVFQILGSIFPFIEKKILLSKQNWLKNKINNTGRGIS